MPNDGGDAFRQAGPRQQEAGAPALPGLLPPLLGVEADAGGREGVEEGEGPPGPPGPLGPLGPLLGDEGELEGPLPGVE